MCSITLLTIGDELLKGSIVNTNASDAGKLLRSYGYQLKQVWTISDDGPAISQAVQAALSQTEVVILSGGLGPTKDDITKHTLAKLFDSDWKWDETTLKRLEARYASRGRVLNDLTRAQARVPSVCRVLPNLMGTAPGMEFSQDEKRLYALPGVPFEMLHLLEQQVIPALQKQFPAAILLRKVLRLAGVPESEAAARLDALEQTFPPELSLSYLPRRDGLWLELSVQASQEQAAEVKTMLEQMADQVAAIFPKELYATDESPLPQLLLTLMEQQHATLAVAESITGGRIAAELVGISGASRVFQGSITAYATAVKESLLAIPAAFIAQHGVVSAEVAMAMAEGVRQRLGADFGLATTGYAEAPEGGQAEVWIGFASKSGQEARQERLVYDRPVNLDRATQYALQFCFEKARQYFF